MTIDVDLFSAQSSNDTDTIFKIASSRAEREAAFGLIYHSYLHSGLGSPNSFKMRVTPYHLLPSTELFIAIHKGEVITTVSLVIDGDLGLPLETVYRGEVQRRRNQGFKLAEVSCLADRRRDFRRFFPSFIQLSRLMVQYARSRGVDQLLVAVHPKHERFYRRFMAFESIGQQRDYPLVRNKPAVPLCLNFPAIDRNPPKNYDTFFKVPVNDHTLAPQPLNAEEKEHFRPMVFTEFQPARSPHPSVSAPEDHAVEVEKTVVNG